MATKHTAAPWTIEDGYAVVHDYADGDTGTIASVQWTGDDAETESNAHLIAAAPELLAALEAWEKAIPRLDEFASVSPDSLRGKALAAIAKAKGE